MAFCFVSNTKSRVWWTSLREMCFIMNIWCELLLLFKYFQASFLPIPIWKPAFKQNTEVIYLNMFVMRKKKDVSACSVSIFRAVFLSLILTMLLCIPCLLVCCCDSFCFLVLRLLLLAYCVSLPLVFFFSNRCLGLTCRALPFSNSFR